MEGGFPGCRRDSGADSSPHRIPLNSRSRSCRRVRREPGGCGRSWSPDSIRPPALELQHGDGACKRWDGTEMPSPNRATAFVENGVGVHATAGTRRPAASMSGRVDVRALLDDRQQRRRCRCPRATPGHRTRRRPRRRREAVGRRAPRAPRSSAAHYGRHPSRRPLRPRPSSVLTNPRISRGSEHTGSGRPWGWP